MSPELSMLPLQMNHVGPMIGIDGKLLILYAFVKVRVYLTLWKINLVN